MSGLATGVAAVTAGGVAARYGPVYEPYGIAGISARGDYLAVGSSRGATPLQWAGP